MNLDSKNKSFIGSLLVVVGIAIIIWFDGKPVEGADDRIDRIMLFCVGLPFIFWGIVLHFKNK